MSSGRASYVVSIALFLTVLLGWALHAFAAPLSPGTSSESARNVKVRPHTGALQYRREVARRRTESVRSARRKAVKRARAARSPASSRGYRKAVVYDGPQDIGQALLHRFDKTLQDSGASIILPRQPASSPLSVDVDGDAIGGDGFPADTTVTVQVNNDGKGTKEVRTESDGSFVIWNWSDDNEANYLSAADTVTANWSTETTEMVVQNLEAGIDLASETVTGTAFVPGGGALEGRKVEAVIYGYVDGLEKARESTLVAADGSYSIDFSAGDELFRGRQVMVTLFNNPDGSENGHRTIRQPYNGIPTLGVQVDHDWIKGWNFPADTTVTIEVDDGASGSREVRTNHWGRFYTDNWSEGSDTPLLAAGGRVFADYGGMPGEMTIKDVQAAVNVDVDTVTGTASDPDGGDLAGSFVEVWVKKTWEDADPLASKMTTVQPGGSFVADFSTGAETLDLVRGQKVFVTLSEGPGPNGNQTMHAPYNDIPDLGVQLDHDWIDGNGFPPDTTYTVSVNDGGKGARDVKTDTWGYLWVDNWSEGEDSRLISPGDTITATGGTDSAEMVVQDVQSSVDFEGNRVTGTAFEPGGGPALENRKVTASVHEDWEQEPFLQMETTVQPDGSFVLDGGGTDIERGDKIFLTLYDADDGSDSGNRTMREPYNSLPFLGVQVDYDWVEGEGFTRDTSVTITGNGGAKGSHEVKTDWWGNLSVDWWSEGDEDHVLRAGDTVAASWDGTGTQMVIQNVQPTVNVTGDQIVGTARDSLGAALAGRRVNTWIRYDWEDEEEAASNDTTVQPDASFGLGFDGFDLRRGQAVFVTLYDADDGTINGHRTMRAPWNELPRLGVNLDYDSIEGGNFVSSSMPVTVTVNDGDKGTKAFTTDEDNSFTADYWSDGDPEHQVEPGDTISVYYEDEATEMTVKDVWALVDLVDDRVWGAAAYPDGTPMDGAAVQTEVLEWWNGPRIDERWTQTDGEGAFDIDYANYQDWPPFDIQDNQRLGIAVFDDPDGESNYTMRIGVPRISSQLSLTSLQPSVAYGSRVYLTGTLLGDGGEPITDADVVVTKSVAPGDHQEDGFAVWDPDERVYKATRTITRNTVFGLEFRGNAHFLPSESNGTTHTVRAWLSTPAVSRSVVRRNAYFVTSGYLKPQHTGYTRLEYYLKIGRRWILKRAVNARNTNYSTYTKYALRYRLPYAGYWKVSAYHSDASHLATRSNPRYLTVTP